MKKEIENKVTHLRKKAGMTQKELAAVSAVHIRQIQSFESGEREIGNASFRTALRIADALGVDPHELI